MSETQATEHAQPRVIASRYSLLNQLGRGGMGTVWLADDQLVHRRVAVKELRPPPGLSAEELATFRQRAIQEATSAARIHHPGAVTLFDVIPATAADDAVYLIMEYIEGSSLAQLIRSQGPLPDATVAAYGLQLLDVLAAAHELGIVHRDVKPANIMITAAGQAKLTDFGIAHILGNTRITITGVIGTQAYMAPELFESQPISPAVDLWALGVTLYAATSGNSPFDRDNTAATLRAILFENIPAPRCGPALAAAITGLLQRDPAHRATAGQASLVLGHAAAAPSTPTPPPLESPAPPSASDAETTLSRRPLPGPAPSPAPPPTSAVPPSPAPPLASAPPPSPAPLSSPAPLLTSTPPPSPALRARSVSPRWKLVAAIMAPVVVAGGIVGAVLLAAPSPPPNPSPTTGATHATQHASPPAATISARRIATLAGLGAEDVNSISFSSNGREVLTSGKASALHDDGAWLWNAATGAEIDTGIPAAAVWSLAALSPAGSTLAFGSVDSSGLNSNIDLWSVADRKLAAAWIPPASIGVGGMVYSVAYSPDSRTLAVGSDASTSLYLYDAATHRLITILTDPNDGDEQISSIVFSPNGAMLAAADNASGKIFIWNVARRRLLGMLLPPGIVTGMAFSPDGGTLALANGGHDILRWNTATRTMESPAAGSRDNDLDSVAFSPDGKILATGDATGDIALWDVASGKAITTVTDPASSLQFDSHEIDSLAFSPNGKTLAVGQANGLAYLWTLTGVR